MTKEDNFKIAADFLIHGVFAYNAEDYEKAVELYRKAADIKEAQFNLGICYYEGKGIEQDYSKAAECFTKAADQGYADAQYVLGFCYYEGEGVKQDYAKAAECFTKAANHGHADAQEALAKLKEMRNEQ